MASRPAPLKQSELTRYAKAMRAAGVGSWRIEFENPDGTRVSLIVGEAENGNHAGANPCDRLLE